VLFLYCIGIIPYESITVIFEVRFWAVQRRYVGFSEHDRLIVRSFLGHTDYGNSKREAGSKQEAGLLIQDPDQNSVEKARQGAKGGLGFSLLHRIEDLLPKAEGEDGKEEETDNIG